MTLKRRLDAVESSLSPTQLVLRWLAEAHAFGNVESYVASLLAADPPQAPLDRLARQAARGARNATHGKRPEIVGAAVRDALRETVFRYELVMRIYVMARELIDREALIDAALSAHVSLLTSEEPRPARYAERLRELRDLIAGRSANCERSRKRAQSSRSATSMAIGRSSPTWPRPGTSSSRARR
jgi:hypothetical protein